VLLTILTPTLNCNDTVCQALASAEALECLFPGQIEHLIGDAGSDDGTWEQLQGHASRHPWVRLHQWPRANIPRTLNHLLNDASGTWVLVLNGDDYLVPAAMGDCLAGCVTTDHRIVCGNIALVLPGIGEIGTRVCDLKSVRRYMSVNHPAVLTHRSCFELVGPFNEACPTSYDYEWLWRSEQLAIPMRHFPEITAHFRLGGLSTRKAALAIGEIFTSRMAAGYPIAATRYYVLHTAKRWLDLLHFPLWHWSRRLERKLTGSLVHITYRPHK
jgi:glycosyltransferase involved in cell wall biosynthesis